MKRIAAYLLLVFGLYAPVCTLAYAQPASPPAFKQDTLVIKNDSEHHFIVEIAKTRAQQEYGLMFRKTMPRNHGMLFIWNEEQPITMWMKNTLIPLDMLFIDSHGKVIYIARNATPGSLDPIGPRQPARAVIELLGGSAKRANIHVGDQVISSYFTP